MEVRSATAVTVLVPLLKENKEAIETWEVGKKHKNPVGDMDVVESIKVVYSQWPHIEIDYEYFGQEWILDRILYIAFQVENYADIRRAKQKERDESLISGLHGEQGGD